MQLDLAAVDQRIEVAADKDDTSRAPSESTSTATIGTINFPREQQPERSRITLAHGLEAALEGGDRSGRTVQRVPSGGSP